MEREAGDPALPYSNILWLSPFFSRPHLFARIEKETLCKYLGWHGRKCHVDPTETLHMKMLLRARVLILELLFHADLEQRDTNVQSVNLSSVVKCTQ